MERSELLGQVQYCENVNWWLPAVKKKREGGRHCAHTCITNICESPPVR